MGEIPRKTGKDRRDSSQFPSVPTPQASKKVCCLWFVLVVGFTVLVVRFPLLY